MCNIKTSLWCLIVAVVLIGPGGWDAVLAQQPEVQRSLTRGQLWSTFRKTGTQGYRQDTYFGDEVDLMYPGFWVSSRDFEEYWGSDPRQVIQSYTEPEFLYNCGRGEGIWIMTREGMEFNVSGSNPWVNTDDIAEMIYDPSKGPERDLGVQATSHMTGALKANYWPGAPAIVADLTEIHNYEYGRYIPVSTEAEEIVISQWTTERGITVTRRAKAWSYPDYDDFFILEIAFENTGDATGDGLPDADRGLPVTLNDAYFAFVNNMYVSEAQRSWLNAGVGGHAYWHQPGMGDDWIKYSEASNFDGLPGLRGKKIFYVYDGDDPTTSDDDTGGPVFLNQAPSGVQSRGALIDGQLMAFQYIGFAPLDYMPPFTNDAEIYVAPKVADQPVSATWWPVTSQSDFTMPAPGKSADEEIYMELIGKGTTPAIMENPTTLQKATTAQVYGPYDLAPGDKAKIVVAFVAGSGAEFAGPGGGPMDVFAWSRMGDKTHLDDGERALLQHLERAQFAYDNGYKLPKPPPDVAIKVASDENGNLAISWSDAVDSAIDPDYTGADAQDVKGYRVYRAEFRHIGPWTQIADIPAGGPYPANTEYDANATWVSAGRESASEPGIYTYHDVESVPGFEYYYSVRSYDTGHSTWTNGISTLSDLDSGQQQRIQTGLESGGAAPEQRVNLSDSPIVIATDQKDALLEPVRVVPNPYIPDDVHRYAGSERIRFVNIPRKCKISIYSISGDLVGVIDHPRRPTDAPAGEQSWTQATYNFSTQVSSGHYFYIVESLVPGQEGKIAKGIFAVIR